MPSPDMHRLGARAVIVRDGAILAVEFDDENGLHYNLPGGGLEPGETMPEGLQREVWEETRAEIDVGRLLLVYEHVPAAVDYVYGDQRVLFLFFEGHLKPGCEPHLPENPDPNETAVKWIPLDEFPRIQLYPQFKDLILQALRDEYPRELFTQRI